MLNIIEYGKFKSQGKEKSKKQIILCHTSREVKEYLASLKYRYNLKYDKIPNFIITRKGETLQLLKPDHYSGFFHNDLINKNAITICLENLGWLEKKPLSKDYINWKGNIYSSEVYEKKWRDYFFWQPYTDKQLNSLVELCENMTDKFKINKQFIGHNTKVYNIEKFEGIVCRSNFDTMYTDLSPSFDYELFSKKFENEQYAQ